MNLVNEGESALLAASVLAEVCPCEAVATCPRDAAWLARTGASAIYAWLETTTRYSQAYEALCSFGL